MPDKVYYSGEQDDFDIFDVPDVPAEPVVEDKFGIYEAEEESNFEDWEEEAPVDPVFEELKKQ